MTLFLLTLAIFLVLPCTLAQGTAPPPPPEDVANCTCGFYDPEADLVFTDSTIVYFNETDIIPDDLVVETFTNMYDRGWNALYRQGAVENNVAFTNDSTARNLSTLALTCNPADNNGLVVGASVRTARQDIFFGSFRTSMRGPRPWMKGSALSMLLNHNQTESWDIDIMNTDNQSYAWVSMLAEGQFSNVWLGANFTTLLADGMEPWFYTEYRVDWTRDRIDYYIGGVLQQSYTTEINGTLPSTPAPLRWQHWSLGNPYNTQGPPGQPSQANIGWTRIFFNSSTTTEEEQMAFDQRCTPAAACNMNNNNLRGSSVYSAEALVPWQQFQPKWKIPWLPLTIDIVFFALFLVLTTKTLRRRFSWAALYNFLGISKRKSISSSSMPSSTSDPNSEKDVAGMTGKDFESGDSDVASSIQEGLSPRFPRDLHYTDCSPPSFSEAQTPLPEYQTPRPSQWPSRVNSTDDLAIQPLPLAGSMMSGVHMEGSPSTSSGRLSQYHVAAGQGQAMESSHNSSSSNNSLPRIDTKKPVLETTSKDVAQVTVREEKKSGNEVKIVAVSDTTAKPQPPKQVRIDYLAGFISMSAILVTMDHFGLTFWAAVIIPSVRPHYQSEIWARKTIATYFLDPLWIGPFLMISTRFLTSNYLKTGKLDNMALKIVSRPFRLLVPVASIATLEYFLMDAGALKWLEYLASVTWSPWPFTTIVSNPGVFISEIIQLAYLIPDAAPMITYNYCTGVLWTIPVQLQGAWQTLLALIMVKECKTPWKRFAFYAFCITNHWYGLSWGSYYYAGVLLADLDITFKYKTWLHPRPWAYYPLLWFLIAVVLGGFTIDAISQWTGVEYAEVEYGWHPDKASGLTISQSGNSVYPDYFIPRLNALLVTVGMQMIVEISPAVQKVLSIKPLQWLFPHIFTIYLIHGFIFWSVGSWAMVSIFSYGCPYWLCLLLTTIICYGTLFGSLPLLTPPIEMLGKKLTLSIWDHASQPPVPTKPTMYPFDRELLVRDMKASRETVSVFEKSGLPAGSNEKGKGNITVEAREV